MDNYLPFIWSLVTLGIAGFILYRAYQVQGKAAFTSSTVLDTISDARSRASEIAEIVQIAVNAAEQLKREKQIQTNDEALNHALDLAKRWIPDEWEVPNEDVINFINAAVLQASSLSKVAGVSSENGSKNSS